MFTNSFYHYCKKGTEIEWAMDADLPFDLYNFLYDPTLQNFKTSQEVCSSAA